MMAQLEIEFQEIMKFHDFIDSTSHMTYINSQKPHKSISYSKFLTLNAIYSNLHKSRYIAMQINDRLFTNVL